MSLRPQTDLAVPDQTSRVDPPAWPNRCRARFMSFHLPRAEVKREALSIAVGPDGWRLLSLVYGADSPEHLSRVPAVDTLRWRVEETAE